ncbi:MAG TPA: hypothetical protein VIK72_09380 [Clostridiaceae bacterium]
MIINKKVELVTGQVEYQTIWEHDFMRDGETDYEYMKFTTIRELLELISEKQLNRLKEETDCDKVIVSGIVLNGSGEMARFRGGIGERKLEGFITVDIDNQDIDKRIINNLEAIKKIVENTLSEHPIAYRV